MSKHTPGPWTMGPLESNGGYDCMTSGISITAKGPRCAGQEVDLIVDIDGGDYGQQFCVDDIPERRRMEADARLIAAAPDLLEALTKLWRLALQTNNNIPHDMLEAIARARDATNKATGQ